MFRVIFAAQALVYWLLMPSIHDRMDLAYNPPLVAGVAACVALLIGFFIYRSDTRFESSLSPLVPRAILPLVFAFLALMYIYVSLTNGLINRRQGSEVMADIFARLPLIELTIIRVFEIIFVPMLVVIIFSTRGIATKLFVIATAIIALPFMGLADSRGRIIVIALSILALVKIGDVVRFLSSSIRIYIVAISVVAVSTYMTIQRASNYNFLSDFIFVEIVERFDGMKLVTELKDYGFLNYVGSFDLRMFDPLIAKVPFLEAAQVAKLAGRTSSKQFYLQDLLGTTRLDDSNSMIADPLYFGGLAGVVIAFVLLGFLIGRFDSYIKSGRLLHERLWFSVCVSFVAAFSVIEADFVGAFATFAQSFIIIYAFALLAFESRGPVRAGEAPQTAASDVWFTGTQSARA